MVSRHRDDTRRARRRILGIGIFALGLTFVIGAPFYVESVESDLEHRVPVELAEQGFTGVLATFDGQDGTLRCDRPLADPEAARQAAYDVWGVRAIELDRSCRVNPGADDATDEDDVVTDTTPPAEPDDSEPPDDTVDDPSAASTTTTIATEPAFDTVQDALLGTPQLSLFAVLSQEAGLAIDLGDPAAEQSTVFAPSDEAFEALPADLLADLRADPDALRDVLLHHMTDGRLAAADFVTGPLTMRDGEQIDLDADGPTIGDADISVTDIEATTGIVHVVDAVLVPGDLILPEPPQAASVTADYTPGAIDLRGVVSTEAVRATLRSAAEGEGVVVTEQLSVDPDTGLDAATGERLAVLIATMRTNMVDGMAGFDGTDLFLSGTVDSDEARIAVVAAANSVGVEPELNDARATDADAAQLEAELNEVVEEDPILFEPNSATITEESELVLDQLAEQALRYVGVLITVQGHTDSDGGATANQVLSEARAFAVQQALIERGLPAASLRFEGFGSTEPILVDGVEDKAASRRVEFAVEATS